MRVILVTTLTKELPSIQADYIGVDRGAYFLAQHNIHMKYAIGDFDSIDSNVLDEIRQYTDEIKILNPIKDDSDCESAIHTAISLGYDEIIIAGGIGGRLDHTFVNIRLVEQYPNCVSLYDQQNKVYALQKGSHTIQKDDYTYISLFTLTNATITLDGFRYPLKHRNITYSDCYTLSNEIINNSGTIHVEEGIVVVMQTKDM